MISETCNSSEQDERQHHLVMTDILKRKFQEVRASVSSRHAEMMQIKQQLQDQIRDLDHVDKANLRQAADMASRVGEFSVENQSRLERQIESPYFGRIDCHDVDEPQSRAVYIGIAGFADPTLGRLIYDWRAPISSMFYDFELGGGRSFLQCEELPRTNRSAHALCRSDEGHA